MQTDYAHLAVGIADIGHLVVFCGYPLLALNKPRFLPAYQVAYTVRHCRFRSGDGFRAGIYVDVWVD
ncbi:hypothetical protein [Neisseria polysaccharea]|uniref:hypothetical protein n=1 Tax=Neisseria polysaccharea TaxID=489 RepID=UPI0013895019|nr:hypothetical protein [Neisseria polysaccharea]